MTPRRTGVLFACLAALGPACTRDAPPERGPRYLTIGEDALGTAAVVGRLHDAHLRVLATGDEVAVIAFDAEDLEPDVRAPGRGLRDRTAAR